MNVGEFFKQMENDKAELKRLVGSWKVGRRKPRGLQPDRWKGKGGKWKEVQKEVVTICCDLSWEGGRQNQADSGGSERAAANHLEKSLLNVHGEPNSSTCTQPEEKLNY